MKVCDLTQFYSPVGGGVGRYLQAKAAYVRATPGLEHVVIVPGAEDSCERNGTACRYTMRSPVISRAAQYRMMLRLGEVERILERERPALIESGDPYQVGWLAARVGRALRIPVVHFYHSHFPEAYLRRGGPLVLALAQRYVRALYSSGARTLVPSPALAEVLQRWGVPRVVPVDLGVDTAVFCPSETPARGEQKKLLFVGRLAPEKNIATLLAAWRLLAVPHAHWRLLVIGDGALRSELTRLCAEDRRVEFIPYCGDTLALAQHYRDADLLVHPGLQETFGLVTLEAQACGTPVVGIRGSYMDRIVIGGQELWARENAPAALASAIEETLLCGPTLSRAALAAEVAARYSWESVFARLFALYREVVAE